MKKRILATVLVSGVALAAVAPTALAANPAETPVTVELTKGGTKEEEGPYANALTIVFSPDFFAFEGTTSEGILKNTNFNSDNQFLVVNDDRRDTTDPTTHVSSEWELTGSLSELVDTTAPTKKLAGNMNFKTSALQNYDIGELAIKDDGVTIDYLPQKFDPAAPATTHSGDYAKTDNVVLPADGSTSAVVMEKTTTTVHPKGERGIQTKVTDNQLALAAAAARAEGSYAGKVTWTLSAR